MSDTPLPLVCPDWRLPGVHALMSTRQGGVSAAPWASLNLGRTVGDAPDAVAENRRRFVAALDGARPVWLRHVHGKGLLRLTAQTREHPDAAADGAWTTERGIACIVNAADCLPVLLASADGRVVGAAHAGWRGLAAGVVEALLTAMTEGADLPAEALHAWLGPCIGPRHFEVGDDVLRAFGADPLADDQPGFACTPRADGTRRWHADLPGLARDRLERAGVLKIWHAGACTYADGSRFFSHRRDGVTGRMAAAVWRG